jgi:hypothetical protein
VPNRDRARPRLGHFKMSSSVRELGMRDPESDDICQQRSLRACDRRSPTHTTHLIFTPTWKFSRETTPSAVTYEASRVTSIPFQFLRIPPKRMCATLSFTSRPFPKLDRSTVDCHGSYLTVRITSRAYENCCPFYINCSSYLSVGEPRSTHHASTRPSVNPIQTSRPPPLGRSCNTP